MHVADHRYVTALHGSELYTSRSDVRVRLLLMYSRVQMCICLRGSAGLHV